MASNPFFSVPLRVRWAETDPQGIVFNGHYLNYFDVCITEFWRSLGLPYPNGLAEFGVDLFLVHAELDYRAPARYDDELTLAMTGANAGNTSLTFSIVVSRGDAALTEGKLVYVVADAESHEPRRVPDALRERLGNTVA